MTALWSWFINAPSSVMPTQALIAIASVAVVIWTGGFIVRGWMRTTGGLVAGMSFLQFAFFGAILTLLASPLTLRCAALAFFVYYLVFFGYHTKRLREVEGDALPVIPLLHVLSGRRDLFWVGMQLIELAPFAIVFVWPESVVVAWVCLAMTFLGYQVMLTFVYGDVLAARKGTSSAG